MYTTILPSHITGIPTRIYSKFRCILRGKFHFFVCTPQLPYATFSGYFPGSDPILIQYSRM